MTVPGGTVPVASDGKHEFGVTSIERPGTAQQPLFSGNQKTLWDDKEYGGETFTWHGTNAEDLNSGVVLDATVLFDPPRGFPERGVGSILELHDSGFPGGANVHL